MKFYCMSTFGDAAGFWYFSLPKATKEHGGRETLDKASTGEIQLSKPISLRLGGRKKVDILYGENAFFATKKAIDAFTANNLTGWDTFPVRIIAKGSFSEMVCGIVFKGKAKNLSRIDPIKGPQLAFQLNTWDGSDFFSSGMNGGMKFLTETAVEAIHAANLKGVVFDEVTPQ